MKNDYDNLNDSIGNDENTTCLKEITLDENNFKSFKITKDDLAEIMDKYLTRKFTEDLDYLMNKGGIL